MAVIDSNIENYENDVLNAEQPVLLQFWADWWEPCLEFQPDFLALSEKFPQIKFVRIDTDHNFQLFEKFKLSDTPALLFFRNSQAVAQFALTENVVANFQNVSEFIEQRLEKTEQLKTSQALLASLKATQTDQTQHWLETSVAAFEQDVLNQEKPVILLSHWSRPHDLAIRLEQAFEQYAQQFSEKIQFVKLNRNDESDEMEHLAQTQDLNLWQGFPISIPILYAYKNGQKILSSNHDEENKWAYFACQQLEKELNTTEILDTFIFKLFTSKVKS